MTTYYQIPYYIIKNNKIINEILYNIFSNEIITRNKINRFTTSCKFTQLRYMILYIYEKIINKSIIDIYLNRNNNNGEYGIMLKDISLLMKELMMNKNIPEYNIILNNQIYPNYINQQIIPIQNYNEFHNYILTKNPIQNIYTNICFCIFNLYESTFYIIHYFTIIIKNNGDGTLTYYLNSAYGSDNVCIPQYTTEIDITELKLFFKTFQDIEQNKDEFNYIFSKYFGKGGLPQDYSEESIEENKKLKFSTISPSVGLQDEISHFSKNSKIGIIHEYEEYILHIKSIIKGGKPRIKSNKKSKKRTKLRCKNKTNKILKSMI